MKQKMRNHIRSCGQVTGFLSHYHTLSNRITAEQDAADGGLAGEVWRHSITSWRRTGGDRRRIKGI